jgi:hypothetical protein
VIDEKLARDLRKTYEEAVRKMLNESGADSEKLGNDILSGVPEIAAFIGETVRRTYYLLEKGLIPAGKLGSVWVASKRKLRGHYDDLTGDSS